MVRGRRRKALYEVIGKSLPKTGKTYVPLHTEKSSSEPAEPNKAIEQTRWPTKPKMLQFNAGRVEISISYQKAIAVVLVFLLFVLVVFQAGQIAGKSQRAGKEQTPETGGSNSMDNIAAADSTSETELIGTESPEPKWSFGKVTPRVEETEPVNQKGSNRIIITQCNTRRDLLPLQKHFANNGIETVIQPRNGKYFLVTKKESYENPRKFGTDGFIAKKKIIKVGADYQAPTGYKIFSGFSDAYGEKVK